jgi:signal transduction histidine kinase
VASGAAGFGAARGRFAYASVVDTGCGIPNGQIDSIFEPFVQGEIGLSSRAPGTGLGLAISRRLARMMNGELTAESTVGVGSTFTLWLPAAARPSRPAQVAPASTDVHEEIVAAH